MTKETQTKIRVMAESMTSDLYADYSRVGYLNTPAAQLLAQLEVARQFALLTEEMHRLNKKLDETMVGKP